MNAKSQNELQKCKNIARIFRNKAMSLFFTGAPSSRLFCRKSNEMHEFSFASTFSVVTLHAAFVHFFPCASCEFLLLLLSLLFFFTLLYCHFPSLIILLSTQCLYAAAFCRAALRLFHIGRNEFGSCVCFFFSFGSKV